MSTSLDPTPKKSDADLDALRIDRSAPRARTRRKGMSGWTKLAIALVLLALLGFLFRPRIEAFIDSVNLPEVQIQRVVAKSAASVAAVTGTSANGYVVAKTRAALSADTPGRIVELNVEEGSVVKKGDVVARLYSDEYAASLRRAEADFASTETSIGRARAEITSAEKALDTQRAQLASAQADIAQYDAGEWMAKIALDRAVKLLESDVGSIDSRDRAQRDLTESNARVSAAKARMDVANVELARVEAQIEVARAGEREAQSRLAVAKAAVDLARATLDKTAVKAPFDGVVVLKDAEVGEVVSPNSQGGSSARGSVVTMVDFATLELQAEVQETSIASVKIGADARIYLDAYPEKAYPGRVDRIWPTANRTKATVEVRVSFLERDERLRPEMGARVVFVDPGTAPSAVNADEAPSILIPSDAVVAQKGTRGVFVLERDVVRFQTVETGESRAGRIVVTKGLSDGQQIVVAPPASLADGSRVRVAVK